MALVSTNGTGVTHLMKSNGRLGTIKGASKVKNIATRELINSVPSALKRRHTVQVAELTGPFSVA